MTLHRVFIPPTAIWEKPRMGFLGCGSTFLGGWSSRGVIDAPQAGGVVVGAEATGRWGLDALHGARCPGEWSLCPPAWKIQEGLVRGVSTPPGFGGCNPPNSPGAVGAIGESSVRYWFWIVPYVKGS